MYAPSMVYSMSDTDILRAMGEKVKIVRLNANITREQLQEASGIHKKTIGDLENGKNVTMSTYIAVLRGLNKLNLLDTLLEDELVSPILTYKTQGKMPRRASGTSELIGRRRMKA